MRDWLDAQAAYEKALRLVEAVPDEAYRTSHRAHVLETAGYLHYDRGKALELRPAEAMVEFQCALSLTEDEIAILNPTGPSPLLIRAHFNWSEFRLALDRVAGGPVASHLARACEHWRSAMHMARVLGLQALENEAAQLLQQHGPHAPCEHSAQA